MLARRTPSPTVLRSTPRATTIRRPPRPSTRSLLHRTSAAMPQRPRSRSHSHSRRYTCLSPPTHIPLRDATLSFLMPLHSTPTTCRHQNTRLRATDNLGGEEQVRWTLLLKHWVRFRTSHCAALDPAACLRQSSDSLRGRQAGKQQQAFSTRRAGTSGLGTRPR